MSLVNRAITHRRTRPVSVNLGGWLDQAGRDFPYLGRDELLGIAGLRAVLGVDPKEATSTWLGNGRHGGFERMVSSVPSLVRARTLGATRAMIDCGAPSPDCTFESDWSFRYCAPTSGPGSIEMASWRTRDNGMVNNDLLSDTRETIIATLDSGVVITAVDALPQTSQLIDVGPGQDGLTEEADHFDAGSGVIERPLSVPDAAAAAIEAELASGYCPTRPTPGGGLSVDLAGGRAFDAGSLELRQAASGWELAARVPEDLTPIERQRTYRAALTHLTGLALHFREINPGLASQLDEHVAAITAPTRQADRHTTAWTPARSAEVHGDRVEIVAGRWYPIGIRVIGGVDINQYGAAANAQKWVGLRKRTFTRGFRAKTREDKRIFTARRPGYLVDAEGERRPYIRYVAHGDPRDEFSVAAAEANTWFWEVRPRGIQPEDGVEAGGLLLVTGWSRTGNVLAYGEELFAMLTAFASVMTAQDPTARIQTLYVAT